MMIRIRLLACAPLLSALIVILLLAVSTPVHGVCLASNLNYTAGPTENYGQIGWSLCAGALPCPNVPFLLTYYGQDCNYTVYTGPGTRVKVSWIDAYMNPSAPDPEYVRYYDGNNNFRGSMTAGGASGVIAGGGANLLLTAKVNVVFHSPAAPPPPTQPYSVEFWSLLWERWPYNTNLIVGTLPTLWYFTAGFEQLGCNAVETYFRTAFPTVPLTKKTDFGTDLGDITAAPGGARDVIILCEEANFQYLANTPYQTTNVPIIVLGPYNALPSVTAMVAGDTEIGEVVNQPTLNVQGNISSFIANPAHPLAAGLSGYTYPYTIPNGYSWLTPGPEAEVVAVLSNNSVIAPNKAVIMMYEKGARMQSGVVASGRRIFIPSLYLVPDAERNAIDALQIRVAIEVAMRTASIDSNPFSAPRFVESTFLPSILLSVRNTRDAALLTTDSSTRLTLAVIGNGSLVGSAIANATAGVGVLSNLRVALHPGVNSATIQLRVGCTVAKSCYWATSATAIVDRPGYGQISPASTVSGLSTAPDAAPADGLRFTVTAVDVYGYPKPIGGDLVEAFIAVPSGGQIALAVVDQGNGLYTVDAASSVGGSVTVGVRAGGVALASSPFQVFIAISCAPGQFAVTSTGPCKLCAVGAYRSAADNQTACVSCPKGTTTVSAPATEITDCVCEVGFFNALANVTGVPCQPCRRGGVCLGGQAAPYAQPGFYPGADGVFVECTGSQSACLGGSEFACRRGHTGRLCASCIKGYFKINRVCTPCKPGERSLIALAVIVSIVLAGLLAVLNANSGSVVKYTSVSIAFNALQIIALYGQLSLSWPPIVTRFFAAFSLANFSPELLAPECSFAGANAFVLRYAMIMLLPLYFAFVYALLLVIFVLPQQAIAAAFGSGFRSSFSRLVAEPEGERSTWPALATVRYTCARTFWDSINLKLAVATFARCWWQLMSLAYMPLVSTALSYINCVKFADGKTTLNADKSVSCDNTTYLQFLPVAIALILLYAVALPVGLAMLLRRKRASLDAARFAILYGFLVGRFRDDAYLSELKIMARKFGVVVAVLFLASYPEIQGVMAAVVLIAVMVEHNQTRAFRALRHNHLETFALGCATMVLLLGVAFDSRSTSTAVATGFLLLFVILLLLALVGVFISDLVTVRREEATAASAFTGKQAVNEFTHVGESSASSFRGGVTSGLTSYEPSARNEATVTRNSMDLATADTVQSSVALDTYRSQAADAPPPRPPRSGVPRILDTAPVVSAQLNSAAVETA